jgi:hypothetical protein
MVDFYDTFWSFFSGLGSNLNGVGKIGCLEVATMVIDPGNDLGFSCL